LTAIAFALSWPMIPDRWPRQPVRLKESDLDKQATGPFMDQWKVGGVAGTDAVCENPNFPVSIEVAQLLNRNNRRSRFLSARDSQCHGRNRAYSEGIRVGHVQSDLIEVSVLISRLI
jgi:hypothetical protein